MQDPNVMTVFASHRAAAPVRGLGRFCLGMLGVSLCGYAYWGRGFAYLGIPPLYVDFVLWLLCVAYLAFSRVTIQALATVPGALLAAFMMWGTIAVVEGIGPYGLDALRDGVLWAYGVLALAVACLVWRHPVETLILRWYGRWMTWLPCWIPVSMAAIWKLGDTLPELPWGPDGGMPALNVKGGDVAVHLAGLLAFWLLMRGKVRAGWCSSPFFLLCWLASAGIVFSLSRGGFVAIFTAAAFLLPHVGVSRWSAFLYLLACAVIGVVLFDFNFDSGLSRAISLDQILLNITSIFQDVDTYAGTGSKQWRLDWWANIVDYTVFGDYFWQGKGCGINLATDDGFQVLAEEALRSPHNGHLTVLARTGVPGLALWVGFLGVLFHRLRSGYLLRRRLGQYQGADLRLWVATYVLAGVINASFDVYLEGPQGGVWFWCLVGLALGLILRDGGMARYERALGAQQIPHQWR